MTIDATQNDRGELISRIETLEEGLKEEREARKDLEDELEEERQARKELEETVDQQADRLEMQSGLIQNLADQVDDLEEDLVTQEWVTAEMGQEIDRLEKEIAIQASNIGGAYSRISDLEDEVGEGGSNASNQGSEADEDGSGGEKTPLEQIVDLPYETAANRLGATDKRARHIAMMIEEIGRETMKGHVIDSRDVRTTLSSSDLVNGRAHDEQVRRTMDALEDMGNGEVTSNMKRGKRRMAFSEELVERMHHHECGDGDQTQSPPDTVMIVG